MLTHVAFRTLLDITDVYGKDEIYVPRTFTVDLAYRFFQRTDPFNVMIKNYEEKQNEMMEKQIIGTLQERNGLLAAEVKRKPS